MLEYLEAAKINYILDDSLLPTKSYMSQTIFTIHDNKGNRPVIYGFGARYNGLAKRIGMKRELPAIGATMLIDPKSISAKTKHRVEKPRFFFIHVGNEARSKSLLLVETLRQADVQVLHAIIKDKLGSQISEADAAGTPYTILMGQKEYVEQCVIVRNNTNRSQSNVKVSDLVTYIKKLK